MAAGAEAGDRPARPATERRHQRWPDGAAAGRGRPRGDGARNGRRCRPARRSAAATPWAVEDVLREVDAPGPRRPRRRPGGARPPGAPCRPRPTSHPRRGWPAEDSAARAGRPGWPTACSSRGGRPRWRSGSTVWSWRLASMRRRKGAPSAHVRSLGEPDEDGLGGVAGPKTRSSSASTQSSSARRSPVSSRHRCRRSGGRPRRSPSGAARNSPKHPRATGKFSCPARASSVSTFTGLGHDVSSGLADKCSRTTPGTRRPLGCCTDAPPPVKPVGRTRGRTRGGAARRPEWGPARRRRRRWRPGECGPGRWSAGLAGAAPAVAEQGAGLGGVELLAQTPVHQLEQSAGARARARRAPRSAAAWSKPPPPTPRRRRTAPRRSRPQRRPPR